MGSGAAADEGGGASIADMNAMLPIQNANPFLTFYSPYELTGIFHELARILAHLLIDIRDSVPAERMNCCACLAKAATSQKPCAMILRSHKIYPG